MARLNLPDSTLSVMTAARSKGTWGQYESSLKKWKVYCEQQGWSIWDPNVTHCLLFLTKLFDEGLSYSAINTCRSALSSLLDEVQGVPLGQHKYMKSFMTGVN